MCSGVLDGLDWTEKLWMMLLMPILYLFSSKNGSPSRSMLPLLQEQAVPQVAVQPWRSRPQGSFNFSVEEGRFLMHVLDQDF